MYYTRKLEGQRRLWQMLANLNGQMINYSAISTALGVSHSTVRNYRDLLGAEVDIIAESGNKRFAIECKASVSPKISAGTYTAIRDINPMASLVVAPVKTGWPMQKGITIVSLSECISMLS